MKIDLILHLKRYTLSCVQVSSSSSVCACLSMLWNVLALAWVAEVLDMCPLSRSRSSPPHGGELPCPLHQDPGSPESQSDWRREM